MLASAFETFFGSAPGGAILPLSNRGSFGKPFLQRSALCSTRRRRDRIVGAPFAPTATSGRGAQERSRDATACGARSRARPLTAPSTVAAHTVRHPLSVSPFSSRSGHCRPQHPRQKGRCRHVPNAVRLSRPQEECRGHRRPSRQGQPSAVVSGGTRAPGDAASFNGHSITEAELAAISPHAVQQHGELTCDGDYGLAPAASLDQCPSPAVQPARAR